MSISPVPQEQPAEPFVPAFSTALPAENIGKGALLSLLTVPAGMAAWTVVWGFGFIASIVAAGVSFLAVRLYLWGAGRISRAGAFVVLAVTVVTLALAFFAGIVLDAAMGFGDLSGLGAWGAFVHPDFWPAFWDVMPVAFGDYVPDLLWAVGFGALGSFATLRGAFAASRPAVADEPAAIAPTAPQPDAGVESTGAAE